MVKSRDQIGQSDEHNARGIELADRGWLDEAVGEFKKAIDLDPKSAHAHDNLATVLAEKGALLDALIEYVEALRVDPESPTAHHYLASFLASRSYDLAVSEYKKALEVEFEFPDAHLNLALAYADRGLINEALTELEVAHKQAPDDEMIQHELACCLMDTQRYTDAIGHLKKIVKNHPEHVEAYVDLGIAYTAQGFYEEAENIFQKALAIDNNDFACHYQIAALYAAWQRPNDAFDHLEKALTLDRERLKQWLSEDRVFDSLHTDERFGKILG